jgi:16S rRNA C1402 (ribose-2'-O) methylase RsmI
MALTLALLLARLFIKDKVFEVRSATNSAAETSTIITVSTMSKVIIAICDAGVTGIAYSGNQITVTHSAGLDFRVLILGTPIG